MREKQLLDRSETLNFKVMVEKYNNDVKIVAEEIYRIYQMRLREDGVLHTHVTKGGKWSPEDYKVIFPLIGKMVNFQKVPLLITYDEFVFPPAEATAYWANSETTCPYFSCEGLVLDSLPLKILGNFYLKFNKPERPTRIFDNQKKAIQWLKTFL